MALNDDPPLLAVPAHSAAGLPHGWPRVASGGSDGCACRDADADAACRCGAAEVAAATAAATAIPAAPPFPRQLAAQNPTPARTSILSRTLTRTRTPNGQPPSHSFKPPPPASTPPVPVQPEPHSLSPLLARGGGPPTRAGCTVAPHTSIPVCLQVGVLVQTAPTGAAAGDCCGPHSPSQPWQGYICTTRFVEGGFPR